MKLDLAKFEGSLPYASELLGIYQPLLGWKSKRQARRFKRVGSDLGNALLTKVATGVRPVADVTLSDHPLEWRVDRFAVGTDRPLAGLRRPSPLDSVIAARLANRLDGADPDDPGWMDVFRRDAVEALLQDAQQEIEDRHRNLVQSVLESPAGQDQRGVAAEYGPVLTTELAHESVVAGALVKLHDKGDLQALRDLFFTPIDDDTETANAFARQLDPLETFDPATDLDRVSLSPIGIVHLYRQWFFEFDTFLGPPVQHLWLSPGGSVELVEVSTRRTLIERTIEQSIETIQKSEHEQKTQDEISEAIKNENESNTKLGVGVDTKTGWNMKVFSADIGTSTKFDMASGQKQSREQSHKTNREQSDKVSTELRQSFKSVFRTVSETTDTSSRRYLLANTTLDLVNYEMRRKMRQVGVQLQDVGTRLCWQSYVDLPGRELGVGKLVHIAEPPDLTQVQHPALIAAPEPEIKGQPVTLSGEWFFEDRQYGFVPFLGTLELLAPQPGFVFNRAEVVVTDGDHWQFEARAVDPVPIDNGQGGSESVFSRLQVGVVTAPGGLETDEHPRFTVQVTQFFRPSAKLVHDIGAQNDQKLKDAKAAEQVLAEEAFFKAARERIEQAAGIEPRKFEDLREEERIVVYRALVRQLLADAGLQTNQPALRHAIAELIQAMFDMDSMLYFVAPEWWAPKPLPGDRTGYGSPQSVGIGNKAGFDSRNVVSWGGAGEDRPDNYYLTDKSAPARLGSSLGWLLQLDGDNFRNAFLNAPWVKAVVPIRPTKELAALNWLTFNHVEGSAGLDARYQSSGAAESQKMLNTLKAFPWPDGDPLIQRYATLDPADLTLHDAIRYLTISIMAKHEESVKKIDDPDDPALSYLPTDRVYEKGFSPLAGGFKADFPEPFEIYDQWIEVVPTDQIVPVPVEYDPKTGMQK